MESKATILLSIEYDAVRRQICEFLHALGCHILEAHTRADVLAIAEGHWGDIDVLLADTSLQLGRMLASEVLTRRPGLRVLLISGEPEDVNRALLPDASVEFIEKPFAWRELKCKVESMVRNVRASHFEFLN